MESNYMPVVRIQRWYRSTHLYKKKDIWWPIDSYNGSKYSYNKWINPDALIIKRPRRKNNICFLYNCVIL